MNETERAEVLARLDRLERLEEQVFFQEQTISALNDALTGQQRQLDMLEGRLARAEEKVKTLWEQLGEDGGVLTVPPHYL